MSISGLSNHLYVVVTTIISLLVAPSTFHQAHASLVSDDFTESRQFKKNLAVSKYKDNPHWIQDYVWKPPEKYYGLRNRPKWEMETTTESRSSSFKQKELEKWEKKMRDLSNRARRKWKIYEAQEKLQPKSDEMLSKESNNKDTEVPDGWMNNLHNGRWGMSVNKPAGSDFSTDSPKRSEKSDFVRQPSEGTTLRGMIPDGRWEMSLYKAPKYFMKEISKSQLKSSSTISPKSLATRTLMRQPDDGAARAATFSNDRWGMSVEKAPKDFMKEISESQIKLLPRDSLQPLESINSMSQAGDDVTSATTISNGRWDITVKEAPKDFLKETSRRSQILAISGSVWKQDEDPKSTGKRKLHGASEVRMKKVNVAEEPVESNLPKVFASSRWGMSWDLLPREFLREISKRCLSGIPEFYKFTTVHQRAHQVVNNNLQSWELMFPQMSGISNIPLSRIFPSLIGSPKCPVCLLIKLKNLPDCNCALLSQIPNRGQFL